MHKLLKVIIKLVLSLVLIIIISIAATGVYIYHYHDQIITRALKTLMASTPYPTEVKKAKIRLSKDFHQLSLILHEVTIHNPSRDSNGLAFDTITCNFNIMAWLKGEYTIDHVAIEHGICHLPFPTPIDTKNHTSSVQLPILCPKVTCKNIIVRYTQKTNTVETAIKYVQADIKVTDQVLDVHLLGDINIQKIDYKDISSSKMIPCGMKTHLQYNAATKVYQIISATTQNPVCTLQVNGRWCSDTSKPFTNVKFHMQDIDLQHLLTYVSSPSLNQYLPHNQPTGFLTCKIHWQQYQRTALKADFSYKKGTISLPGISENLQIAHVAGSLSLLHGTSKKGVSLVVDEYVVTLGDSQIKGACHIMDLSKPILQARFGLQLKLNSLVRYTNNDNAQVQNLRGELVGTCAYQLPLHDITFDSIKNAPPLLTGEFEAKGLQFQYNNMSLQLEDTMIQLQADGTFSIPELVGKLDGKTFVCNCKLHHGNALLIGKQPSHFTAKVYAEYIALDQLFSTSETGKLTGIGWWPQLAGVFVFDLDEVAYKRFRGKKLGAKLQVNVQQVKIEDFVCWFAGGKIELATNMKHSLQGMNIVTRASLQHIPLATLFATCENFHQKFLIDQHLAGKVSSQITLSMSADKHFNIDSSSIEGNLIVQLDDGVLKDFEPLKQLSNYVSDDALHELHFSSLKNTIRIQNKTIYIPPMQVHTSVTSIELSGTHTFDGSIDYRLVVPLHQITNESIAKYRTSSDDKAFEGLNLYLKLQGDVNNYTLTYDGKLLKKALQESLKEQAATLGNLLRAKKKQELGDKKIAFGDYFKFE